MATQPPYRPVPDPDNGGSAGRIALWIAGALLVLTLAIALFMIRSIDRRMAQLEDQFTAVLRSVEETSRTSRDAADRAEEAVRFASEAAQGRRAAEFERDAAEQRTRSAQQEAVRARQEAASERREKERLIQQREDEINRIQERLNRIATTTRTALGVVLNLGEDSLKFDFNKATLRPENREILSRIAGVLLTLEGFGIYVYGHTDDVGSVEYNQQLSERRAESVKNYLVDAGIDSSIITTRGFGKTRPLTDRTDARSRARNRRVEIGIVNTDVKYRKPVSQ